MTKFIYIPLDVHIDSRDLMLNCLYLLSNIYRSSEVYTKGGEFSVSADILTDTVAAENYTFPADIKNVIIYCYAQGNKINKRQLEMLYILTNKLNVAGITNVEVFFGR